MPFQEGPLSGAPLSTPQPEAVAGLPPAIRDFDSVTLASAGSVALSIPGVGLSSTVVATILDANGGGGSVPTLNGPALFAAGITPFADTMVLDLDTSAATGTFFVVLTNTAGASAIYQGDVI